MDSQLDGKYSWPLKKTQVWTEVQLNSMGQLNYVCQLKKKIYE